MLNYLVFHFFFIFNPIWGNDGNDPIWLLIFFRWVGEKPPTSETCWKFPPPQRWSFITVSDTRRGCLLFLSSKNPPISIIARFSLLKHKILLVQKFGAKHLHVVDPKKWTQKTTLEDSPGEPLWYSCFRISDPSNSKERNQPYPTTVTWQPPQQIQGISPSHWGLHIG